MSGGGWYDEFYQGLALDFWRVAVPPERTAAEADFLEAALSVPSGGALLDVPCGNGRLALELARRGYALSGVDRSEPFLQEAHARALDEGLEIEWRHGDMRELPWQTSFDGAFCFGNSFGYHDAQGTAAFLRAVARALKPGGRFVLETATVAEALLPGLAERLWLQREGITVLVENRYRVAESRLETAYTFIRGGERERRVAQHWVFTVGEVGRMLEQAGMEPLALFASLEQEPFEPGAETLLLVAEKARPE